VAGSTQARHVQARRTLAQVRQSALGEPTRFAEVAAALGNQ